MRAHYNRALLDLQGNQVPVATVRLLVPGGTDLLGSTVYAEATGGVTRTNPWETTDGEVDFYLDAPERVKIGVKVGSDPEEFWDDIDVLGVGNDSTHPGTGEDSLQIGVGAAAEGVHTTALGQGAQAAGDQATALGEQALAAGSGSFAAGSQALASQSGSVAVGQSSVSQGSQSTAIGAGAQASYDQSTAVGAGAQTDRPHQVVLGTADDQVDIPGRAVLRSPNGTSFLLAVTDDGALYTQELPPYEEPPPIEEGEGEGGP